jgi:two-component system, NarL family, sensor histidine kinase ComP
MCKKHNSIEKSLDENEAMYRLIAENMTDLIVVLDKESRIQYASTSHKNVLGFDNACLLATSIFDYISQQDLNYAEKEFLKMVRTKSNHQARCRFMHANGCEVYVDCLGTPVLDDDGEVKSIVVVSRDISETVRIENELRDSEERYRRLIELSPQPIATHRDGKFTYINPAGVVLLGANDESEVIGKAIYDIVHPDYVEISRKRIQSVIEKKYIGSMEYRMIRIDGQLIDVEVIGIYDEKAQSTLALFKDITQRKKMERAIQESKERYRRLVELSPVGIAVYKNNTVIYVNPAAMKVVGAKSLKDIIGTGPLDWVHLDDQEYANQGIENTLLNGYSSPIEIKIVRLDGEVVDVSVTAIYDSQSSTIQLVFQDITARKQAERALLESEELNRRLVELCPEAIVLHSDYKFNYVNPAGLTLFAASKEDDIVGQSILDTIHPDFKEEVILGLDVIYKEQSTSPFLDHKLVRLDGTVIDIEVIATSIPYKGKNAGLSIFRNITERKKIEQDRKRAEQLIRESQERYFRLQTSLDRFSHDLFGLMKVDEMERRLVKEVQDVMNTTNVSVIQLDRNNHAVIKHGDPDMSKKLLEYVLVDNLDSLPVCTIVDVPDGCFLKIGENREGICLLCIGEKTPILKIRPESVWLKTIARYVSVLYDNFRLIEDLTKEIEQITSNKVAPSWLVRLLFNLSENERKALSQDLHDGALQEQIIWYRKLEQLSTERCVPQDIQEQLQQITQGLLDVIYQIRITCNELRPPMLKEVGLVSSVEALFEFTQMRTNYCIQFDASNFHHTLHDDQLLGLYRIVQELLANATKHSNATQVQVTLSSDRDKIELIYQDNGIGMNLSKMEDSFTSMGVYGIKERVRSMDGKIEFHSSPNNGLVIFISIPILLTVEY